MAFVNKPAECHPEKSDFAKGLCHNCYAKQRRDANKDAFNKQKREYRLKNLERFRERDRIRAKAYRLTRLDAARKQARDSYQRNKTKRILYQKTRNYGIAPEVYLKMIAERQGRCDVCDELAKYLTIDHCHKTKQVRGLLCPTCNSGLGMFRDNPELLEKAAKYVYGVKK